MRVAKCDRDATPQSMTLRRVARDGALALALGAVVGDRVGAPERALARRASASSDARDAFEAVVVWCDRASVARGAIDAGDVVAVRARDGDGIVIQRVDAGARALARDVRAASGRGMARTRRARRRRRGRDADGGASRTDRRGAVAAERDAGGDEGRVEANAGRRETRTRCVELELEARARARARERELKPYPGRRKPFDAQIELERHRRRRRARVDRHVAIPQLRAV